ncbi:hypothetical protein ABJI51_40260 [Amycolatopsis sp. NEAU-NG30]|uniref:Uncharacterized protein n=1 Tax=Amycolatopsis melonis TaxID=3156488 RepID=A0ABV0LSR4_9PSEU
MGASDAPNATLGALDFEIPSGLRKVLCAARGEPVAAAWDGPRITALAVAADHRDAQAVLVPETALHTTPLLSGLEERLRKPVLTATAVTVWDALARAGEAPVRDGLGALFRSGAGRRPSSFAS